MNYVPGDWIWHDYGLSVGNFFGYGGVPALAVAGVELEIEGRDNTVLVGDINDLRGVCDDCTDLDRGEIVTRYRQLSRREAA